ncbi:leucyl aminopeptidase [Paenibacillus thermoaerophilus]|uniref:Probable cytosol aminopeptidase n=1 Tax=Paenibacillus thermoaerophilus TaxID=1215385 RepID=A0ABW2V8E1_9BACL|nr:leucyl aminopeptidase [Paenibacillus thermoaerophilus]
MTRGQKNGDVFSDAGSRHIYGRADAGFGASGIVWDIGDSRGPLPAGFDAWIVPYRANEAAQAAASLPAPLAEAVLELQRRGTLTGKPGAVERLPTCGLLPVPYVLLTGLGSEPGPLRPHALRAAMAAAARAAAALGATALAATLPATAPLSQEAPAAGAYSASPWARPRPNAEAAGEPARDFGSAARAAAEGLVLGAYRPASYKAAAGQAAPAALRRVSLRPAAPLDAASARSLREAAELGALYAEATGYARDLVNLPSNKLTPDDLAREAKRLADRFGLQCEVLDEADLLARGMLGLYTVGQGSAHPPRLITLRYQGKPEWTDVIGFVGKGITFDTGGISIKPGEGMEEMISDMGGAAVLLGVARALGVRRPPLNAVFVIPAAENMPSGSAYKPGDIIRTYSGRTVEVLNTDAEGRIVLGDGVTYAIEQGAQRLIEVSTLTGAVLIALGDVATMALANDEAFLNRFLRTAAPSGEKIWPMPAYPEYWAMLESDVADLKNMTSPRKWAGAITAGLFVGAFAENIPWIHLDTGGTAWLWSETVLDPKGGSGSVTRAILYYLEAEAQASSAAGAG